MTPPPTAKASTIPTDTRVYTDKFAGFFEVKGNDISYTKVNGKSTKYVTMNASSGTLPKKRRLFVRKDGTSGTSYYVIVLFYTTSAGSTQYVDVKITITASPSPKTVNASPVDLGSPFNDDKKMNSEVLDVIAVGAGDTQNTRLIALTKHTS
jgi:hypothetical protein